MILKRAHIKNFRSLKDVEVSFGKQTAIIGGNGTGKSTILKAIEKFYGPSSSVSSDDFYGSEVGDPIEIGLTFTEFSDAEREVFASRIANDELNVVRVFEPNGGRASGRYFGFIKGHEPFRVIRNADGAMAKRGIYRELRKNAPELYAGLEDIGKADEIEQQLSAWELGNPARCTLVRDDGQFLGFTNVARGSLSKFTSFVFIPAVRDAAADAIDGRGSAIARLMELVVKSAIQRRKDFLDWQEKTSTEYRELVSSENLPELHGLSDELTKSLRILYEDTSVSLEWQPAADFNIPLPSATVSLEDGGFPSSVEKQGNGLQRAFILTLLQHLARATVLSAADSQDGKVNQSNEQYSGVIPEIKGVPETPPLLPGIILAIEEPELYQHPTKQRHFARVLSLLSNGVLPGVARTTQIVFASHSPYFVCMDRFDEVRLTRRTQNDDEKCMECAIRESDLEMVCRLLERAHGKSKGSYSGDALRSRLHIITPELAEGFFADVVVLVEGESDRAAIMATAAVKEIDLEAMGMAILAAGGKNNLDRPAAIFMSLEIPTYTVWDCDRSGSKIDGEQANRALHRLFGFGEVQGQEAAITVIEERFACFERNLEKTLESELGASDLDSALSETMGEFLVDRRDDAIKSPRIMKETLDRLARRGITSPSLNAVLDRICELKKKSS
ncbi:MAG: ATP-dependent endonuclease [Terracidiphilus sp.]|nr:ATP-dependent endonuclease [Terracidiphilus sp.]